MADHDHSYKLLFSHAELVADLLGGFVHEPWVEQLDLTTLERVSGSYVSDDLREREDDLIWRVRWGEGWLYVYLLLEFQSTVDRYMAVRLLTYVGLLYQDLIKSKQTLKDGRLPPVLPLVLYNGETRWNASEEIADLIVPVPGGLEAYRPSLKYLLLDEGRYDETELAGLRNMAAAVFRLENSRTPEDVRRVVRLLLEWLHAPEQTELRRAFTVWLGRVLLPGRLSGVELPLINELQEVETMLAERAKEWTKQWWEGGVEQGMQQGMQQGVQQGEVAVLLRQIKRKYGPTVAAAFQQRVEQADAETLLVWSERILTAESIDDIFG